MSIKRIVGINVTNGTSKEDLQEFLDMVPDGVKITPDFHAEQPDRPGCSVHIIARLDAEWTA